MFIWLSVFGLITGIQLVEENLDNRSRAEINENNEICRYLEDLGCKRGSIVWTDDMAVDGDYNWMCVDEEDVLLEECSLKKTSN